MSESVNEQHIEPEPVAESIQIPIHEPMAESEPTIESTPSVFTPSEEDFVNGIDNSNP